MPVVQADDGVALHEVRLWMDGQLDPVLDRLLRLLDTVDRRSADWRHFDKRTVFADGPQPLEAEP